jgi:hypothetical protein
MARRPKIIPLSRDEAARRIEVVQEALSEGFPWEHAAGDVTARGAVGEAARRLGLRSASTLRSSLKSAKRKFDLEVDLATYAPRQGRKAFVVDDLPDDGEADAETLIERLKAQHEQRSAHARAKRLHQVRVAIDGPIGLAFFGDPHIDSPGCDWVQLEADVHACRDTEGVLAVNVGDTSENWVGRLTALYADQDVTTRQTMKLVEWLLKSIPWLLTIGGNHDLWNTERADPLEIIHRQANLQGLYEGSGARLQLNLPAGASAVAHIRHDFPGRSLFNPAHAMVRETLFGYRDHILACGHTHQSGYMGVWHNDPERLCHGFRVGSYKALDPYGIEKGLKPENWAKSMMAVIDPDHADNPVRFVRPCFSIEEGAEYLTWRRSHWRAGRTRAG